MSHTPVLLSETLQMLAIKPNGFYVDATFGRGGHSRAILNALGKEGRLLAVDRDLEAINSETARALLKDKRFALKQGCFSALESILTEEAMMGRVDGLLLDLGVSSPQLDNPDRGFSFVKDGPLDMRMNTAMGVSAAEWLARVGEQELADVLFHYGEERFARRIARTVVEARKQAPITTTSQLVKLIEHAQPIRDKYKHPATRSFQAIRIEVNKEIEELKALLEQSLRILKQGGRLVVISFHSLEDKIVKQFINAESGAKYDPGKLPVKEQDRVKGQLKKLGKAIKATDAEVEQNPRARSAIMRVAEKV